MKRQIRYEPVQNFTDSLSSRCSLDDNRKPREIQHTNKFNS